METPKPAIGRIVHYRPLEAEQKRGNDAEVLPAMIVCVFNDEMVNLRVTADGMPDRDFWATSVQRGSGPGKWDWPPRV